LEFYYNFIRMTDTHRTTTTTNNTRPMTHKQQHPVTNRYYYFTYKNLTTIYAVKKMKNNAVDQW